MRKLTSTMTAGRNMTPTAVPVDYSTTMQEPALGEPSVRRAQPSAATTTRPTPSTDAITFPDDPAPPQQVLLTDAAVLQWHRSPGFRAFWGWTTRRCDRIKGKDILEGDFAASSPVSLILRVDDPS